MGYYRTTGQFAKRTGLFFLAISPGESLSISLVNVTFVQLAPLISNLTDSQDLLSSVEASRRFGVTNDYITSLCRKKKIQGLLMGRLWMVECESLQRYLQDMRERREKQRYDLSRQGRTQDHSQIHLDI